MEPWLDLVEQIVVVDSHSDDGAWEMWRERLSNHPGTSLHQRPRVWVTINGNEPVVAGILVSGVELDTEGYSLIGVRATSMQSGTLVQAAKTSIGQTSRSKSYEINERGDIPERGQLTRTFRVRGMPESIS
jgi:hypothetical protein